MAVGQYSTKDFHVIGPLTFNIHVLRIAENLPLGVDWGARCLVVESDMAISMTHAGTLLAECGRECEPFCPPPW